MSFEILANYSMSHQNQQHIWKLSIQNTNTNLFFPAMFQVMQYATLYFIKISLNLIINA